MHLPPLRRASDKGGNRNKYSWLAPINHHAVLFEVGINANGIVKGNTASFYSNGIIANSIVTRNLAVNKAAGIQVSAGSTPPGIPLPPTRARG
jgi:Ni,Fe-hydrogenase I large subunit